ncbi:MAG: hypothetical protein AB7P99_00665 [Vicinamibacterales bacterium]|jgi:hypothetical protein
MAQSGRVVCTVAALAAALIWAPASAWSQDSSSQPGRNDADKKPSLSLRATPSLGFTPLRVVVSAELKGGANDYADLYCTTVEWDWDDETISENTEDCAPYEAGKSEIRRRYSATHTFQFPGNYRVYIRLKQKDKVVAATSTNIQVRGGVRQGF